MNIMESYYTNFEFHHVMVFLCSNIWMNFPFMHHGSIKNAKNHSCSHQSGISLKNNGTYACLLLVW